MLNIYKKLSKVIVVIILLSLGLTGCRILEGNFDPSFDVAVMLASNGNKKTKIVYLDKDFNVVYKQNNLKYAGFIDSGKPIVNNNFMYGAPSGNWEDSDGHQIVKINLKDGKVKEYDTGDDVKGPTGFSVCNDVAYLCSNLNRTSIIYRRDLNSGNKKIRKFKDLKDSCMMKVYAAKNRLFSWGIGDSKGQNYVYVFDSKTLKTINKIKFKQSTAYFCSDKENAYILVEEDSDNGVSKSYFGIYNLKKDKYRFKEIKLRANTFLNPIKYKNTVIIPESSDDNKNVKNDGIMIYDVYNNKTSFIKFDDCIEQCEIKGNHLYIY